MYHGKSLGRGRLSFSVNGLAHLGARDASATGDNDFRPGAGLNTQSGRGCPDGVSALPLPFCPGTPCSRLRPVTFITNRPVQLLQPASQWKPVWMASLTPALMIGQLWRTSSTKRMNMKRVQLSQNSQ